MFHFTLYRVFMYLSVVPQYTTEGLVYRYIVGKVNINHVLCTTLLYFTGYTVGTHTLYRL